MIQMLARRPLLPLFALPLLLAPVPSPAQPGSAPYSVDGRGFSRLQDAVDAIARRSGVEAGPCVTDRLALVGAQPRDAVVPGIPRRLLHRYGAEAPMVAAGGSLEPLADDVATTPAELRFAVEHELALTVDDVLDRRTRIGLVPDRRAEVAETARELIEERLPA